MDNGIYDSLSWSTDPEIKKIINNEKLLYSSPLIKINRYNMNQERNFVITSLSVYNFKKKTLKRRIELKNIKGISISKQTDEFVIHGMEIEYDYHYVSFHRLKIIQLLSDAFTEVTKKVLSLCIINDKSLKNYVTSKKEKKKDTFFSRIDETKKYNIIEYLKEEEDKLAIGLIKDISNDIFDINEIKRSKTEKPGRTNTIFSKNKNVNKVSLEDFKVINVIGRGSFGKVCLVEYKPTKENFAMKSIKKDVLLDSNKIESTLLEKKILQSLDHPFLVGMEFCFQTEERIYFVMPFVRGGELFQHLRNFNFFDEEKVRFYAAIIGIGLEYMHKQGIIYRDLKPENILMDEEGYLKIADFGMAKIISKDEKALSFCGTPEYLAPEIISREGHNIAADWWCFGILIFEMLCGIPPFYCDNREKMYDLITHANLKFPKKINVSYRAKDILQRLLVKDQEKRFGSKEGFKEIKEHPFFEGIDFEGIIAKKVKPPFKPALNGLLDIQHFDPEFTSEDIEASLIPKRKLEYIKRNQDKFDEFNE